MATGFVRLRERERPNDRIKKGKTMFKRILPVIALTLGVTTISLGQVRQDLAPLTGAAQKAFTYFDQVEGHRFDEFLRRIRPKKLSPGLKVTALNMLSKEDLVDPSDKAQIKLCAIDPVLRYHERDSTIELKILRVHTAMTAFLAGAAILITEPALEILTSEELQAVAAHELGHEYYWGEFELARQRQRYLEIQELELRCDGIGIITLNRLGLNPESLISAIVKLDNHNQQYGSINSANYIPSEERFRFIRSMIEMTRAGNNRGAARSEQGRLSEALSNFNKAIGMDSGYALAYLNRGILLIDRKIINT